MLKFNIQIVKHTERRERNICERVRLRDSFQFNENYLEKEITDSLRFFFYDKVDIDFINIRTRNKIVRFNTRLRLRSTMRLKIRMIFGTSFGM